MVVGDFAQSVDTIVIGAGPGGYVAAIRAAQLGKKVMVVERENVGGVCLNVGCIPSKALIQASHHFHASTTPGLFGVTNERTTVDFAATQRWKQEQVIDRLTGGVAALLKKNGVEIVRGEAHFVDKHTLRVVFDDAYGQSYSFKEAIIATGSRPIELPFAPFGDRIVSSTGALSFTEVPEQLVVIGGGYIGMELASAYAGFGAQVTVLEGLDMVLAGFETDLVKPVTAHFQQLGGTIVTGARVTAVTESATEATVTYSRGDDVDEIAADRVVVAVGRVPNTDDIGLEILGIAVDDKGLIPVDAQGRTRWPHICAIGDVVAGPPLAHKASFEAKIAAEALAGDAGAANDWLAMPTVCYTSPEIATVGLTAAVAKDQGFDVATAKFPWGANGRALSMATTDGFVRLVSDQQSGRLLGAQIVGSGASELIAELTLAIENLLTVTDVAMTIHSHPTLAEAVMDAAEIALGHPIHQ